ncbi:MAG: 4-hydroxy-3-methylbut-2-enyl diphosphate reductase [Deltaproteobacteria bacterium]|jgi:4-hydroxy-3-methylbut-2-enyl diphosphate reductase|nr:4-hydroxy-3-methylbut-2-enyl diphosphate reductase [Deltaproteobacteria bacterium]
MLVIKAPTAGFCMGVSLAVNKLDKALERTKGKNLYTLGPIIHNPRVVREYEAKGAQCLEDHRLAAAGSTVVIRAHGLPRALEEDLRRHGLNVVDATCPKVKAAQMGIKKAQAAGLGKLLLFGEKDHPEVRGLLSYAGDDALVFSNLDDLRALPLRPDQPCFAAAQTTQDKNAFADVLDYLKHFLHRPPSVLNTICDATMDRQNDVLELTRKTRSMVIVGGLNSGNTRRLADISRQLGIFTVHCESSTDLPLRRLKDLQPVGLTAGASTPDAHIRAVEKILLEG